MKKRTLKLLSVLLCIAMLAGLAACGGEPGPTAAETPTPTPTPEPTVTEPPLTADGYIAAMEKLTAAEDLTLEYTVTTVRTVSGYDFEEVCRETVTYQGLQTESPSVLREQEMTYFGQTLPFDYLAVGDAVYIDDVYTVPMPAADYLAAMIPVGMVDASLYGSLSGSESRLEFSDAAALEPWVADENAELTAASAVAELDAAGGLTALTYRAEYHRNGVDVALTVEMEVAAVNSGADLSSKIPADTAALVELPDVRIPDLFYRAMLAPETSPAQTSTALTVYTVEAGAFVMQDSVTVNSVGTGSGLKLTIEEVQDAVEGGETYRWNTTATYKDGVYRLEADGQVQEQELPASQVSPSAATTTLIMEPDFLAECEFSEVLGCYLVEFTGADWMAIQMDDYICSMFYNDATLLDSMASSYSTTEFSGYLSVDADTMLPVGYNLEYAGKHIIDGTGYGIGISNLVTFDLTSDTAYEEITGEKLPDEEPAAEDKATPLLYHVTGADGQEMWLFGTIHIGDERTAFLPQKLYDAFDASDALALEYDGDEFDRLMETDEELQAQISALYYYSDGSTIGKHIDSELYDTAVKAMKATGNYFSYADYMKAGIWENLISNYLSGCSGLSAEKGLEERLQDRAAQNGMEVRSVESALSQMEMLSDFSGPLQEMLLADTLGTTRADYVAVINEMYDLWCEGDEAALIEYLNSTEGMEELTEEEQKLHAEYVKAMESDRNAGMHEVAVDYLESGDVVFYAVGLAHLIGTDGLVDSLRAAGYTVELVEY